MYARLPKFHRELDDFQNSKEKHPLQVPGSQDSPLEHPNSKEKRLLHTPGPQDSLSEQPNSKEKRLLHIPGPLDSPSEYPNSQVSCIPTGAQDAPPRPQFS